MATLTATRDEHAPCRCECAVCRRTRAMDVVFRRSIAPTPHDVAMASPWDVVTSFADAFFPTPLARFIATGALPTPAEAMAARWAALPPANDHVAALRAVTAAVLAGDVAVPDCFAPLFVVGCGRSGTTLLSRFFGCHPRCVDVNEARVVWIHAEPSFDIWSSASARRGGSLVQPARCETPAAAAHTSGAQVPDGECTGGVGEGDDCSAHLSSSASEPVRRCVHIPSLGLSVRSKLRKHTRAADAACTPTTPPRADPPNNPTVPSSFHFPPPPPNSSSVSALHAARRGLFATLLCSPKVEAWAASGAWSRGDVEAIARRFTLLEKSPENLFRTHWLRAAFPRARFVLITRNGAAVAASIAKFAPAAWYGWEGRAKWDGVAAAAVDAGVRIGEDGGGRAITPTPDSMLACGWIEWHVARVWGERLVAAAETSDGAGPGAPCCVRFEELATRPREELQRLLLWTRLPLPDWLAASGAGELGMGEAGDVSAAEEAEMRGAVDKLLASVRPDKAGR